MTLSANVTDADLRAALPAGFDVRPVASGDGKLVFDGTAELFGSRFSGQAVVSVNDGRLKLEPNIPFGGRAVADAVLRSARRGARRRGAKPPERLHVTPSCGCASGRGSAGGREEGGLESRGKG